MRSVILFSLLVYFVLNVTAADSAGAEKAATVAICTVLFNIRDLLIYMALGVGVVAYIPILAGAAIIFLLVKDDKPSVKLVKTAVKVLLALVPLLLVFAIAAIFLLVWFFSSGKC